MQYLPPSVTPIGSYTPWPLGEEDNRGAAQAPGANGAPGGEWWRTWTTPEAAAGTTGMFAQLIGAIRGTPTYPPGTYPPGTAPPTAFPWGTILILGGLLVGGYFLLKAMDKKKKSAVPRLNPWRSRSSEKFPRSSRKASSRRASRGNKGTRHRARRYRRAA